MSLLLPRVPSITDYDVRAVSPYRVRDYRMDDRVACSSSLPPTRLDVKQHDGIDTTHSVTTYKRCAESNPPRRKEDSANEESRQGLGTREGQSPRRCPFLLGPLLSNFL